MRHGLALEYDTKAQFDGVDAFGVAFIFKSICIILRIWHLGVIVISLAYRNDEHAGSPFLLFSFILRLCRLGMYLHIPAQEASKGVTGPIRAELPLCVLGNRERDGISEFDFPASIEPVLSPSAVVSDVALVHNSAYQEDVVESPLPVLLFKVQFEPVFERFRFVLSDQSGSS